MKYPKHTSQILHEVAKRKLSGHDLRVFNDWIADNKSFNPTAGVIANRIGSSRPQVSRSLSKLREEGVLVDKGFKELPSGQSTNIYDLHDTFKEACGITSSTKSPSKTPDAKPNEETARKDMYARKEGYADHKQKKEYLDQFPILTKEMIDKREREIIEAYEKLEDQNTDPQ